MIYKNGPISKDLDFKRAFELWKQGKKSRYHI